MINKSKKNKDLFFIHREKIIAVLVLCLFVWSIFGSFVLFENINSSLAKVEPQFYYSSEKEVESNFEVITTTDLVMVSSTYPVAVMIDNNSLARPHSGLSQADFIYEAPVEGGATRLMAIMNLNKNDVEIGPVRSARPYFVNWAAEFQALYVYAGGSPEALSLITRSPVEDLNEISGYGSLYFYRNKQKSAPHNLYTTTVNLRQALADFKLDNNSFGVYDNYTYATSVPTAGVTSTEVLVDFSEGEVYDAQFIYSLDKKTYHRYDNGSIKIDLSTRLPIDVSNIIIQLIPPKIVLDNVGRLSLSIVGQGSGHLLQAGHRQEITWQKESDFLSTKFYLQNKNVELLPGLTWLLIVPIDREIIFE